MSKRSEGALTVEIPVEEPDTSKRQAEEVERITFEEFCLTKHVSVVTKAGLVVHIGGRVRERNTAARWSALLDEWRNKPVT